MPRSRIRAVRGHYQATPGTKVASYASAQLQTLGPFVPARHSPERLEAVIGDKSDHLFSQATYVTPAHKLGPYIT